MKNKRKVLFVATVASHIKSFHIPYLKMLKENGYKTYVAANWNLSEYDKLDFCDEFIQISIQRSPYSFDNIKAIKKLKQIIDNEGFEIIHCHTPMGGVVTRIAAKKNRKKYGTKVIYTAHGFHFYKGAPLKNWILFYPVEKWLSKYTDSLITINMEDYELANAKFNKRCYDIHYVPGVGVNLKKFDVKLSEIEKSNLYDSIGICKDDYILTCVARLDHNKNQSFLIEVMEQLVKTDSRFHLLLAGRDELHGEYQKIVKEKQLENNVHFLGNRDDVPKILAITNIILSASKREGLPVNVIEAYSAGIPVVVLNCRGMKDLIKNGVNGFIIDDCDKNEFVNKIEMLFSNKKKLSEICENNKKNAKEYDVSNILGIVKKIYNSNR